MHFDEMEFSLPLITIPPHMCYGGSMRGQQTILLLKYYFVAGARGGTSIVQGDCSLTLDTSSTFFMGGALHLQQHVG